MNDHITLPTSLAIGARLFDRVRFVQPAESARNGGGK